MHHTIETILALSFRLLKSYMIYGGLNIEVVCHPHRKKCTTALILSARLTISGLQFSRTLNKEETPAEVPHGTFYEGRSDQHSTHSSSYKNLGLLCERKKIFSLKQTQKGQSLRHYSLY